MSNETPIERLERLKDLKPGWYQGEGDAVDSDLFEPARQFIEAAIPLGFFNDGWIIAPTFNGSILIEFDSPGKPLGHMVEVIKNLKDVVIFEYYDPKYDDEDFANVPDLIERIKSANEV